MQARGPMHDIPLPVWLVAVVVVGVTGTLVLGLPVELLLLTVSILVLAHLYPRDKAAHDAGPVRASPLTADDDDEGPAAPFADHFVAKEFAAARRGRDVTLVMFGFENFDEFSEREGSVAAGNAVREFGRVLRSLTRQMNLSARYGWRADTFLSVLSDADARAAEGFIARVRGAVATCKVKMPEVNAGIAVYQPQLASPEEFVECAKRALVAARAVGHPQPNEILSPLHRAPATRADAVVPRRGRVSRTSG